MSKKAVVSLLGMISNSKPDYISVDGKVKQVFVDIAEENRAIYRFSDNLVEFSKDLKKERYINTLPLLVDVFDDRKIIPIATEKAKSVQMKTLDFLGLDNTILNNTIIVNEADYEGTFQQISELLKNDEYESFIIDLTHGFRHLPILMIVNLIIASIKDIDKVEHIFFAKEIVNAKEYEIIDLLDYIGLAKLSFVLQNFSTNYTVGNHVSFRNEKYQELVDSLRIISGHILGNSIKRLIDGDNSLITETIHKLRELEKTDKKIETFSVYIHAIIKHLQKIQDLEGQEEHVKLFKFSKIMQEREYLLNSITLLNESLGMYCAKKIRSISSEVSDKIDTFMASESSFYELSHQSKNLVKLKSGFKGYYLSEVLPKQEIIQALKLQNNTQLIELIEQVGNLRNNLAHGNSSDKINNVKWEISQLLREYQRIAQIANDVDREEKLKEVRQDKVKPKKEKKKSTGIDASDTQVADLKNLFNNR